MKAFVLEFKLGDKVLGIRTDFVKVVFEIEKVEPIHSNSDYVLGVVEHNEQLYPLLCPAKIADIDVSHCKDPVGKTAIAISHEGKTYAILADKIVQIREIDKKIEEIIVDFYKSEDGLIMEISPDLIEEKLDVPIFTERKKDFFLNEEEIKIETVYLIFKVGRRLIAVPAEKVKKVEELERDKIYSVPGNSWANKVCLLVDTAIKVGDLRDVLEDENGKTEDSNYVVVLGKGRKYIGIVADDIVDLLPMYSTQISKGKEDEMFSTYFCYNRELVSVLSDRFIDELIESSALETQLAESQNRQLNEKEVLVVRIGEHRFAIMMEHVLGILNYGEVKITPCPTDSEYLKGIVVTSTFSHVLLDIEKMLNDKVDVGEETKILVFKEGEAEGAFVISEIEDLISVPEGNIFFDKRPGIIAGAVLDKSGRSINLLNLKQLSSIASCKETK